jgi:hypothetical protein
MSDTNLATALTNYILHLLQDAGNRDKFNRCSLDDNKGYRMKVFQMGEEILFQFCSDKVNMDDYFNRLIEIYQKEIIRIALKSLDEFKSEPKYSFVSHTKISLDGEIISSTNNNWNNLEHKYGQMLYDKSIEEIDEIFKSENIII